MHRHFVVEVWIGDLQSEASCNIDDITIAIRLSLDIEELVRPAMVVPDGQIILPHFLLTIIFADNIKNFLLILIRNNLILYMRARKFVDNLFILEDFIWFEE